MGSFYDDFKKKQNKRQNKPTLLKVPQVVPQKPAKQDNSRRATAARNREQQRVQAHQNAQRPASTYLTGGSTTRSQPYAANQQRNTVFQQRGNTRQGFPGTGSRSTQQNNLRQPASTYLTGGSVTRSQPYAASQQNQLFSARKAAEQRRNPRQNVSTATKSSGDGNPPLTQFLKNSMDWHRTSDPNRKAQLHAQNDALRRKLGYEYNPQTGASFDKFGHEMTAGVRMAYGSKPTERLNQATQLLHTSGVMGKTDKATVYPTAVQAAQGLDEDYFSGQTGYNAHKTMHDLFNRSDETWSSEDTQSRDRARQELSDEMSRIMKRYGLDYQPRDNADDIINRLKAAGADDNTLAYVQENIDLRHAADRLGNSMEAVGKRWIASLPSLVDTSRQVSANVEESRQNEEYRQLEEQEQTLELTLQGMNSTAADGSVPADYQAVYDQLQEVKKRKNELTVNKGVDPNKWSQRMLRGANEAQANAEDGLAPAPRWLTEQGISLAGNAPVMAASAIPVVGPAVGSIMMGGQAAGQRSFELNEQGKGARESLTRGLTSGAIEAATERLPLGQMSKILHSGGTNAVKSILRQMGVEAGEESASYFLNYVADKAAADPDAKFSLAELVQSAAGGAFGGLVFGTAGAAGAKLANNDAPQSSYYDSSSYDTAFADSMRRHDAELRAAQSLPDGPIKDQAVQNARNKMTQTYADYVSGQIAAEAERAAWNGAYDNLPDTPNGFAGKKIPTYDELIEKPDVRVVDIRETPVGSYKEQRKAFLNSEEAKQLYRQPVTNYDTGEMVFVTPKTLDHSFSNGGQVQISAAKQIQQIIESAVLTNAEPVTHGDTNATGVYTLFGAVRTNDGVQPVKLKVKEYQLGNQQIPQNIEEYFNTYGVPEQYASAYDNKVLSLESIEKEEASSSVQPTLAAKQTAQGEYPSASSLKDASSSIATMPFGVNYPSTSSYITVADLMGLVNGDAARYLPKNNNGDVTQAPHATALGTTGIINEMSLTPLTEAPSNYQGSPSETDSFTDTSIRQNVGNSNTSDTNIPLSEAMQYGKTPEQAVMEAKVKKESNAKHAARELYRNIVSGQAEIERFAQMQKKVNPAMPDANDLVQINRVAGSTVDTIAEKALVDRKGDAIGKGWLETVGGLSKEQLAELNLYRLHKHNVDRMSIQGKVSGELGQVRKQYETFLKENPEYTTRSEETIREIAQFGEPEQQIRAKTYLELKTEMNRLQQIRNKPVLARKDKNAAQDKPYTAAESEKILREMDEKNPQLAELAEKAEDFHDAFMREWVVGSGLMSEEQYERLKTYYPHYVQTYRVADNWGGGTDTTRRGSVNTGSPTKQAIGSLKEIIPFEDAEMMQVNSLVKNARRNELFRNIYEFAQAHPEEAASYVRIINADEDTNTQPLSFDDLTGDMAEAAMSDQGGIYTIRALKDGKPITMQVNSAFYAGLQNLFGQDRGASDTFMKKTFGTMTNAFKVFTTGKNPLFFLTNLPKDFQTAYINTTSNRKTLLTWLADVGATVKHMAANDADWQAFQALGGAGGGFYHNEKGFSRSAEDAGKHQIIKKIWAPIDAVSENTEALWRFNEYRAAVQRYGDTEAGRAKAIQAAADVTTNFSRTAPATKAAENYCAYLNASVQGLDKIARQVREHPILTARRAAEIIALPTLLLYLVNKDDDDYKNLNNRTKDNYYCIPIGDGDFLKIPKSREYGVAMGALLERFFRLAEGEEAESAFKGIGEQFMTNLAPSNPVTDNILKTVFIDLPTNRDFAGRSIVPERMEGLSPENQYDYTTSGAGMAIAKGWNATLGRVAGKISPIQADYLIDSNLGFVGDAIIGATTDPKSPAELAKEMQENPVKTVLLPVFNTVKQKFTANPLYQSGVTDAFYDELDAAQRAANDKNLTENLDADIVTPEETYYSALNKSSSEISELRKQERTILADKSLSAEEQEEKVRDIRRQIIEIAKNAKEKAQEEREEYEKTYVPELSPLSEERQKDGREAMQHGLSAKQFVKWDTRFSDLKNKKDADGKHIYSEAESRGRVLEEVMADDTLRSGEKQALADYVLISTMGDNDKEKWNDEVKGKMNASDYVRFKSDVAAYEKEYKGTDTDNAANVKRIIDGYENLNAEQKSVLMSVYSDNASKNLYHVSTYEQQIDKNGSFYKGLSQSGRDNLRSMLNEYESAVNDGKELKEWKAKAYMAEKEADISPATYAMFYIASQKAKGDKSNVSQKAAEAAVNAMDGLTQHQKAYLYQSVNASWKKNPFGSATVGKYESGAETGINPVEGSTVSSPFGPRQTFTTANGATSSKNHHSIDLAAAAGTPIKAFQSGKVTANGWVDGYGWTIEVTHPNGLISQYHHMQNSSSVAVGTEVKQGQTIGNVGSTGNSNGPHLDLSIIKDGKYIDPASVIPALKDSASGYISTDAASYGALTAAAQSSGKKSSGGSGKSDGGSSRLKQLKRLDGLKGLGF